jgi:uncharacterized protein YcbX
MGLQLHHPVSIQLTRHGATNDRLFYLVDHHGTIQSCTRNPELLGLVAVHDPESRRLEVRRGSELLCGGSVEPGHAVDTDMWGLRTITSDLVEEPGWSSFFSHIVGKPVRLLRARESAFDVQPVSLLGTSSLAALSCHAGLSGIDPRRFRMLIEFSGGEPYEEDSWSGELLRVGTALLRVGGPIKRCAATTRNPDTGTVDLQTLRLITAHRGRRDSVLGVGATFGVYCEVLEPGTLSVGDRLHVGTQA